MNTAFDKVLFVISTDCFTSYIFNGYSPSDINIAKQAARHEIRKMLNGGNNYFLDADFSESRLTQTKESFFNSIKMQEASTLISQKIESFYAMLSGASDEVDTATYAILSIASRLHWFHIDDFIKTVPDKLIDIIDSLQSMDMEFDANVVEQNEIEDIWSNSTSEWDAFLRQNQMFDGITDAVCIYLFNILHFNNRLDFFNEWKAILPSEQFNILVKYISDEAHAELDKANPNAAKLINKLLVSDGI
jgi:hypothetical protein